MDLRRLKALHGEIPRTLIARVRVAWPEIKIALNQGHSLKTVHERLTEAGIAITYKRLSEYVTRLRREEKRLGAPPANSGKICATSKRSVDSSVARNATEDEDLRIRNPTKTDAFADFRERTAKAKSFEFEPGPPDESKLI